MPFLPEILLVNTDGIEPELHIANWISQCCEQCFEHGEDLGRTAIEPHQAGAFRELATPRFRHGAIVRLRQQRHGYDIALDVLSTSRQ